MGNKYNMVCENCIHGNICKHVDDITEARSSLVDTPVFRNEDSPVTIIVHCEGFKTNHVTGRLN